jgi:LacI family transcriptional regulator
VARREPHVAVCVDNSRAFGRGILMGLADYLETVGRWSLYVDFQASSLLSPSWLRRWRGDGVLEHTRSLELHRRLKRSGIRMVTTYGLIDTPGVPQVRNDNLAIGRLAGGHFRERRFRYFAYTGFGDNWTDEERYLGFMQGTATDDCPRLHYPRDPASPAEWEQHQVRLSEWIQGLPKPVGIMTCTDLHAVRVLDACRRCGLAVPETIAILGVDNDEEMCRLSDPPLSSVACNPRKVGFAAAQRLDQLMKGELRPQDAAPVLIPPLHVVTRRSTDTLAVEEPLIAEALAFINRRAFDAIGVKDVAKATRTSRKTLYRRFQEVLGRTPHEEIFRLRLQRAQLLLSETPLSLDAIAQSSGMRTASYLSYAFKQKMGMTPGEYRAAVQPHVDR